MKEGIEVPVGGVIVACGAELVCVEDYKIKNGAWVSCGDCPLKDTHSCEYLYCGYAERSDGKSVHFEYHFE